MNVDGSRPDPQNGPWLMRFHALLREPLVLFLAAGAVLYATYATFNRPALANATTHQITIDRKTLLEFMQYRSKAFEPSLFEKRFDSMAPDEREKLTKDYLEEEVLYREALSLGLDSGDYVIRQRMIQKMKFLIDEAMASKSEPAPSQLQTYYDQHKSDYAEPPVYTFTHVFFDKTQRPNPHTDALAALRELNAKHAGFNDALSYGDRPLYFQNYVERTRDFVLEQFGEPMIAALDRETPSDTAWRGPFESPYGWHVVLLTKRDQGHVPPLEQVRGRVLEDFRVTQTEQNRSVTIARLIRQYRVEQADLSK